VPQETRIPPSRKEGMSDRSVIHYFDEESHRNRRDEVTSTLISVLLHALVLSLFITVGGGQIIAIATDAGVGDGIGAGPAGGGGGGGEEYIALTPVEDVPPAAPAAEEQPVEPVPPPLPVPEPEIKPIETPTMALALPDTLLRPTVTPISGAGDGKGTGTVRAQDLEPDRGLEAAGAAVKAAGSAPAWGRAAAGAGRWRRRLRCC
jgi:hypothetical protein